MGGDLGYEGQNGTRHSDFQYVDFYIESDSILKSLQVKASVDPYSCTERCGTHIHP